MFKHVTAKLGNMRQAQQFIITLSNMNNFYIQSDKSCGKFNMHTREGVLNTKGTSHAHLTLKMGAEYFMFPQDFVDQCYQVYGIKNDLIGTSPETGKVYFGGHTEIGGQIAPTHAVPESARVFNAIGEARTSLNRIGRLNQAIYGGIWQNSKTETLYLAVHILTKDADAAYCIIPLNGAIIPVNSKIATKNLIPRTEYDGIWDQFECDYWLPDTNDYSR